MHSSNISYFFFIIIVMVIMSLVGCGPATLKTYSMRTITAPIASNSTWMHPSEIAKDCLNSVGQSMIDVCQKHSEKDYDPGKLNTNITTTWETCCSLYEELDCYLANAKVFCPESTRKSLQDYTTKVVIFFQDSLCHTVIQVGWRQWCDNMTHQAMAKHHITGGDTGMDAQEFIKLPAANGPEKRCFEKLRHAMDEQANNINLEQKCLNASLNRWDPKRNKLYDSDIRDACCAMYDTLECIQIASNSACNASELIDMSSYRQKSLLGLSEICKQVPLDRSAKICGNTSGSRPLLSSFASIALLMLLVAFILCRHYSI